MGSSPGNNLFQKGKVAYIKTKVVRPCASAACSGLTLFNGTGEDTDKARLDNRTPGGVDYYVTAIKSTLLS
jgi:hypothetical protein